MTFQCGILGSVVISLKVKLMLSILGVSIVLYFSKDFIPYSFFQKFTIDVGYERFLGPEIFFHPEVGQQLHIFNSANK